MIIVHASMVLYVVSAKQAALYTRKENKLLTLISYKNQWSKTRCKQHELQQRAMSAIYDKAQGEKHIYSNTALNC